MACSIKLANFGVRRGHEILIPLPDAGKIRRCLHAHHLIGSDYQPVTGFDRRDGDWFPPTFAGSRLARGHHGRPHGGPGREAVIDDDDDLAVDGAGEHRCPGMQAPVGLVQAALMPSHGGAPSRG